MVRVRREREIRFGRKRWGQFFGLGCGSLEIDFPTDIENLFRIFGLVHSGGGCSSSLQWLFRLVHSCRSWTQVKLMDNVLFTYVYLLVTVPHGNLPSTTATSRGIRKSQNFPLFSFQTDISCIPPSFWQRIFAFFSQTSSTLTENLVIFHLGSFGSTIADAYHPKHSSPFPHNHHHHHDHRIEWCNYGWIDDVCAYFGESLKTTTTTTTTRVWKKKKKQRKQRKDKNVNQNTKISWPSYYHHPSSVIFIVSWY